MKLSVIIPVYNTKEYLVDCLESILYQYDDMEIICINDGSTDGSIEVLKQYEQNHTNFIVLDEMNKGVSAARNKGIKAASGDYITFVDSDDKLSADCFETLLPVCYEKNLDVLFFSYKNFDDVPDTEKKYDKLYGQSLRKGNYDGDQVFTGISMLQEFIDNRDYLMTACAGLFRRDMIINKNIYFEEGIIYEDAPYELLLLLNAERVACINIPYYKRRVRSGSIEHSDISAKHLYGYMKSFMYMCEYLCKYEHKWYQKKSLCENVMSRKFNGIIKIYNYMDPEECEKFEEMCSPKEFLFFELMVKRRVNERRMKDDIIQKHKDGNAKLRAKTENITNSRQSHIGKAILKPIRIIKKLFNKK